jgi:acetyltransferase
MTSHLDSVAGLLASSPLEQLPFCAACPPANIAGSCRLHDGTVVTIRPIHDDDVHRLWAFHRGLSPQTIFLRFAHLLGEFPEELAVWLTCVDGDERMAFVATDLSGDLACEQIIAVARYARARPQVAEVAAVVADRWQGRGLGSTLLYRLAAYGRSRGYATFIGYVSSRNARAIHTLMRCNLPHIIKQLDEDMLLASVDITHLDCCVLVES